MHFGRTVVFYIISPHTNKEDKRSDDVESNICGLDVPGMNGPRGRPGKPGTNGEPGSHGINAWTVKLNGSVSNELLIPPSIAGW
jgi:hypothetical protein